MVDEFDWGKVARTLQKTSEAEARIYANATGARVETRLYYWGFIGKGVLEIDEKKRFFGKRELATGTIHPLDNPSNGAKKGDLYIVTGPNGFRQHARHICEEYEKELKYRAFLRVVPNLT
jgi:hypothetical protein